MNINDPFQLHTQFDFSIQKSGNEPSKEEYLIKGKILNPVKDESGETPILEMMDWSYFDQKGMLKFEHDPTEVAIEKGKVVRQRIINDGENIIGVPMKRIVNKDGVYLEARIMPETSQAKKTIQIMKAFEAHNKIHPEAKRNFGFSIEGKYSTKYSDGRYGGKVYNVVLTPQPKDPTTCAELAVTLAKSFAAGYGVSLETQTGGGALRKEDLAGKNNNSKTKKTEKHMFRTPKEVYEDCIKKGMSKEDAKKEAEAFAANKKKSADDASDGMEKSVTASLDYFTKAIDSLTVLQTKVGEGQTVLTGFDTSFKKSLSDMSEDKPVDGAKFMAEQGSAVVEIGKLHTESTDLIAKSITSMASGMKELVNLIKSVRVQSIETQDYVEAMNADVEAMKTGFRKSVNGITANVENFQTDLGEDADKILKSVSRNSVQGFLVQRATTVADPVKQKEYFAAHDSFRMTGINGLSKSLQTEIVEHFKGKN
jgi:hypothetical protein